MQPHEQIMVTLGEAIGFIYNSGLSVLSQIKVLIGII